MGMRSLIDLTGNHGVRRGYELGRVAIDTGVNIRELGGFPTPRGMTRYHRFIRSGTTASVNKEDADALYGYGVRQVLDLRGTDEVRRSPERLVSLIDVGYRNVPLFDYDITGSVLGRGDDDGNYLADSMFQMLENRPAMREIFTFLANVPRRGCTLFHCGAGSDRTGLLSLLLLGLVGVERRQLIADYAYSFGYVPEVNAAIFEEREGTGGRRVRGDLSLRIDAISTVYDRLGKTFGTIEAYLLDCGVRGSEVRQVRSLLLSRWPRRYHMPDDEIVSSSSELAAAKPANPPEPRSSRRFFVNAFENPNKVTADLYYITGRANDLTERIDTNQRDRSFHDHDYVMLEVPETERGILFAPVSGKIMPLSEVGDPAFSDGSCGEGVAIIADGSTVYAPATCRVTAQLPSNNALGLLSQDGMELLLVVGPRAERYAGGGFRQHAWQNDSIRRGTPLISWDPTSVPKANSEPVMLVVTNARELGGVRILVKGSVEVGEAIISFGRQQGNHHSTAKNM